MKALLLALFTTTLAAHAAAAQRAAPGPEWADVTPAGLPMRSMWMDTTAVEVVSPDRFRVRLLFLVGGPMPTPDGKRFDRSLSRVEYDCTGRTSELLEAQWMLGDSVVRTVPPDGRVEHWLPGATEMTLQKCRLARRVTAARSGRADPPAVSP
ncbi:MAG TPA: hypothetical protein VGB15_18365 [Longimicrobium sp.]|jgi:hypothetical protein